MKLKFIIIIAVLFLKISIHRSSESEEIPKIIWTFWNSLDIHPFIQKCIDSWRQHNPDYKIIVLNTENISSYIGCYEAQKIKKFKFNDSVQKYSDLIRYEILDLYGGIWLDASTVLYRSIDWVHNYSSSVFFALTERKITLLENWFIAVSKGNKVIQYINRHFRSIEKYPTVDAYLNTFDQHLLKELKSPRYLLSYLSIEQAYRKYSKDITILSAGHGPLNYQARGGVNSLCNGKQYMAKFRKEERNQILSDPELEKCVFKEIEKFKF